ncbi:ATP-NAD kinase family protein [Alteromonas ponticola]|uniref:ATP-NAD kinase family protein n=1 Tax=Alteromonas aquimaris TaxID=2998417 RepID=A0ABT3P6C0_9ALTE|nr:ATP-NAD kinase family protein [Alteromonas aquimaris]MCW8108321.1 ATP-NAD kinase family protein [Alteromonas aquimaris]
MSNDNHKIFRLGVLVNPFAGIGGALALKGSDGADIREKALAQGAEKKANVKMRLALEKLTELSDNLDIFTAAGEMGETVCKEVGLKYNVLFQPQHEQTEGEDSEQAALAMVDAGVDLLLFAGGDGTARNIYHSVAGRVPVLGVPAGCKIHSGVYAVTPTGAGEIAAKMVRGELVSEQEGEVRDIDENAFRQGKVRAKHYGEMRVPHDLVYLQSVKMGGRESEELVLLDIAAHIAEWMDDHPETYFVMGSGSTVAAIMDELGLPNTLLGVDVIKNKSIIASDVSATELLNLTAQQPTQLVITAIGGQGHLFGRGNQQLSPEFIVSIGKENILVVATKQKLQELEGRPLRLDTSDPKLDDALAGSFSVITGYHDKVIYPAI